jgi:hypothetical protein
MSFHLWNNNSLYETKVKWNLSKLWPSVVLLHNYLLKVGGNPGNDGLEDEMNVSSCLGRGFHERIVVLRSPH